MRTIFILLLIFSSGFSSLSAHTLGIDKAQLTEMPNGSYHLASIVPTRLAHLITPPKLPDHCSFVGNPRGVRGDYEVRFDFTCDSRLTADDNIILPWKREGVILTTIWQDSAPVTKFTKREGGSITINLEEYQAGSGSFWRGVQRYTFFGIRHILEGIDHLLFVLGLLLMVNSPWALVKTITAFTGAHSITLAFATFGFINIPQEPVEAAIALSIVFLAVEIVHAKQGRYNLTYRKPWLVAFGFGLLHGFGFAGALAEIGLPQSEIPVALLFFNVGVELGQLCFVLGCVLVQLALLRIKIAWSSWSRLIPAYCIGTMAFYWLMERIMAIVNQT